MQSLHPMQPLVGTLFNFFKNRRVTQEALVWLLCYFLVRGVSEKAAATGKIRVQPVIDDAKI